MCDTVSHCKESYNSFFFNVGLSILWEESTQPKTYNCAVFKEVVLENPNGHGPHEVDEEGVDTALVLEELRRIVSSRHFQTSRRGTEFLQYVVNQKINGKGNLLKERLIGVAIFGRNPDYSTGEDPVVRVQAGDVRRRLERYHADTDVQSDVLIQIPLGSYAPVFQLRRVVQAPEGVDSPTAAQPVPKDPQESMVEHPDLPYEAPAGSGQADETEAESARPHVPIRGVRRAFVPRLIVVAIACLAVLAFLVRPYLHKLPDSATRAFWLPAAVASKPVLLCLPRPMVYRPSDKLFDRYEQAHPGAFATREARQDQLLPLVPEETIQWGDMSPVRSAGPGIGGVVAAINMSRLLTEQGIRFELRFGEEATYAEMRDSPVLIIGGINTEWTTQLISETSFAFDESRASPNIHETGGAKRVWKQETSDGHVTRDYGLITRQLSGRAGQFLVQVAGISHFGTAAASEILVQPQELEKILRSKSISLQKKNVQIVVSTDVTDERAGPPHVVAASSW